MVEVAVWHLMFPRGDYFYLKGSHFSDFSEAFPPGTARCPQFIRPVQLPYDGLIPKSPWSFVA